MRAILPALSAAVLIVLLGSGCGGSHVPAPVEQRPVPTEKPISLPGYNHFVNANLLELMGAYDDALNEYQQAVYFFPDSRVIRTDYARLLFRLQHIPEALEQALKIEPKSSEIHLLIGDCYRFLEKTSQAIVHYRRAVELDPDNINAYWYLAGYYRQVNELDSAISAYYQLARLSDTYRIWQELGTLLGRAERYDEALAAFNNAVSLNPDKSNLNSYLGLAITYDAIDSLPQAEQALAEAIALDSFDVRIYRQMLAIYLGRGDITKAIDASQRLVTLTPSDWMAQRRLGILLYTDGQLDRADSLFTNRIEFGDDNIINFYYLGRITAEREDYPAALIHFDKAILRDSTFIDGWLNRGYVYRQMDSLDNAIDSYSSGLEYASGTEDSVRLLFALGSTLERNDRFHEAVTVFQELIALDTAHAPALNYLGYMLADRGEDLGYALQLIEKALKIAPDNGAYIDSYAWVNYKLGNYDVALTQLKKAVGLIDDDAIIYEHLGDVYRAMGDRQEAEQSYKRALELDPGSLNLEEKMNK